MFSPSHKRKQEEDDVLLGTGVHVKNNGPRKRVRIGEAEYLDASGVAQAHTKDVDDSEDLELMKGRRGAVKMEGYDSESDSSGAEEDGAEVVEEEGDMFADEAEAPLPAATGSTNGGKKEDKFLRLESIEGQVWRDDAEDFAGEVKLTPFNMEEEMEEGDFDESGHYIRKRDEHLIHDSWLQGVTKNDMEKARAAHAKQEELANESEAEIDGVRDPNHIWLKAIHLMKPGESIPKALRRLAGNKPATNKNKWRKNKKGANPEPVVEEDPKAAERKQSIEQLTAYADSLMGLGALDAYDATYEQVVRNLRSADLLYEDWQPPQE